ncbi:MAG TPA: ATP-binding protein [Candidatus Nanoarchaeia archaeon]|nr:ATP-binding protein [Candidatus Nanoarchaeia archaeon]
MVTEKVKFHAKGEGRALIQIARVYPPKDATREFVTNSLDARIPGTKGEIVLIVNPNERRLIVSDNGTGMSYEKLVSLPTSVGYSEKAGIIDARGEKGLGLLAFGSLGKVMHIITRDYKNSSAGYSYIRWEIDDDKEEVNYEPNKIGTGDMAAFYGNFPHGTRVIIDRVNPHILDKILTVPNLKDWLRLFYNPALMREDVDIRVGRVEKRSKDIKAESLEAINYERGSSSKLINDTLPVNIKREEVPGKLERLLFINPEGVYDKVAVYSKDVLVYESLADLTEFSKSPVWTSGKVSGYVNDFFNKLVLGRDGIDRSRNAFKAWFDSIKELEEKIRPIVEESRKRGKSMQENRHINNIFKVITDVLKEIGREDISSEYVRSKTGILLPVDGIPPSTEHKGEEHKKEPAESKIEKPIRPPGPGRFKEDEDGPRERVKPRQESPFNTPQPIEFEPHHMHLRSRSEYLGTLPTIFINSAHEDYKSRTNLRDSSIFDRYIIDLIAKESTYCDISKAEKNKRLVGEKSEIVKNALEKAEIVKLLTLKRLGIK